MKAVSAGGGEEVQGWTNAQLMLEGARVEGERVAFVLRLVCLLGLALKHATSSIACAEGFLRALKLVK